jgi:hypothetical protein
MEKVDSLKARLIAYYNIGVPSAFILGTIVLYFFAKILRREQGDAFGGWLIFFMALCVFSIVSGIAYLRKSEGGRICLLCSCIIQALYAIRNIKGAFVSSFPLPFLNIAILAVAVWGIWVLQSREGKAYIQSAKGSGESNLGDVHKSIS